MANSITLDGTVFRPEKRVSKSGMSVFTCDLSFYDGKGQDKKSAYGSIRVIAFRDLADNADRAIHEKDKINVEGRLHQESWEKDGKKNYRLEIVANSIGLLVSPFASAASGQSYSSGKQESGSAYGSISDDDIPF